jgi:hypothetical protein
MEIDFSAHSHVDPVWVKRCRDAKGKVELALVAVECLDALAYEMPPSKPHVLEQFARDKQTLEWKHKPGTDKEAVTKKIMGRGEVEEYFREAQKVQVKNYGNALWLEELMYTLLKGDKTDEAHKCWDIHRHYPETLEYGNQTVWNKRKDWS